VMVLVDFQGAGIAVAEKAAAAGIPVIAYDRPIAGADYFVAFDNFTAGVLQGQMILDGLEAAGKDATTASIVSSPGDPTDGYATLLLDGAESVLEPAGATAALTIQGTWDSAKAGVLFEEALTSLEGKVDAVLAPNDNHAAAVISILDKNGLTVPVSGQDATVAGLQNVLLGKQTATVYKPFQLEVDAAVQAIVALLGGGSIDTGKQLEDGTPYIAVDPVSVGAENVKDLVADGHISAADVCTGAAADACERYGVK
jgi:D-xylose transport system substrate-binding protein